MSSICSTRACSLWIAHCLSLHFACGCAFVFSLSPNLGDSIHHVDCLALESSLDMSPIWRQRLVTWCAKLVLNPLLRFVTVLASLGSYQQFIHVLTCSPCWMFLPPCWTHSVRFPKPPTVAVDSGGSTTCLSYDLEQFVPLLQTTQNERSLCVREKFD